MKYQGPAYQQKIDLKLLFLLVITIHFVSSCKPKYRDITEPNYNPHVLKPGNKELAKVTVVNMDSVEKPKYVVAEGVPTKARKIKYNSIPTNYYKAKNPTYILGKERVLNIDSLGEPNYVPAKGKRVPSGWPQWEGSQPLNGRNTRYTVSYLGVEQGLAAGQVFRLLEDRNGKIWIGTNDGLDVWDGSGFYHFKTSDGLANNNIGALLEDKDGKIWIGTGGGGVSVWDGTGFTNFTVEEGLLDNHVRCLLEDSKGRIWTGGPNGISVWDGGGFTRYLMGFKILCFLEDRNGDIWIGTGNGLIKWNGSEFIDFTPDEWHDSRSVWDLIEDKDGNIVMAIRHGLVVWDGKGFSIYTKDHGMIGNGIFDIMEDHKGNIWMPSFHGVCMWDGVGFTWYTRNEGLSYEYIQCSLEDRSGKIWLATWGGGINILDVNGFYHLTEAREEIHTIFEDHKGNIWMGRLGILNKSDFYEVKTHDGQILLGGYRAIEDRKGTIYVGTHFWGMVVWDGSTITNYDDQNGLSHNSIKTFTESADCKIWIATLGGGVNVWDGKGFTHYSIRQGMISDIIYEIYKDHDGNIWMGSYEGDLSVWDGKKFTHFYVEGLRNHRIDKIVQDKKGRFWIGSAGGGLFVLELPRINGKLDWMTGEVVFTHYRKEEGLSDNAVSSIYIDNWNDIWVSTVKGVNRLKISENGKTITNQILLNNDGLASIDVSDVLVDSKDQLWLVANNNVNRIDIDKLSPDTSKPSLAILELQLFYDKLDWRNTKDSFNKGEDPVIESQQLSMAKIKYDSVQPYTNVPIDPTFPHNINHLTLQWSGIHSPAPHKLQYSYILDGKDDYWSPLVKENKVTFTDIRPGNYIFKVRAVGGNGKWSDTASYAFTIRPPLWATVWAYLFYGLCAIVVVLILRRYEKQKFILKEKSRALQEMDRLKTQFFTNISHEFRTPLTLILGPLRNIKDGTFIGDKDAVFGMMIRNGQRLLRLINQLLDLSKLEMGSLKLETRELDVIQFLRRTVSNFDSAAQEKGIIMRFTGPSHSLPLWFDSEKLERAVINLISNAMKFTPEGGKIDIFISDDKEGLEKNKYKEGAIELLVRDSGLGIPQKDLSKIFDRFYQADNSHRRKAEGTGIGLALVKELVELHHGEISVESEQGWGTSFRILLPKGTSNLEDSEIKFGSGQNDVPDGLRESATIELDIESGEGSPLAESPEGRNLPTILIIEDNADMRHYITSCLEDDYQALEADNGKEGLEVAVREIPDMILSDVMMPEMNGYELCIQIRENIATRHIPFILLTAKADKESRISGLKRGADDYLAKPFDAEELRLKVRNQLDRTRNFRSYFSKQLVLNGDIEQVESLDDHFMKKIFSIVDQQIDNSDFTVEQFAIEAGMSQTQLYRKVMALTGQSPNEFIRSLRLKKAAQLMLQQFGNVSDVAYAVGFNNLSYFAKCFKKQFGVSPNEYGKLKKS